MTDRRRGGARRGRLIAIEGIDGAGKSTLLTGLARLLRRQGLSVRLRREPTDPTIGRLAQEAGARDPWTGAVYFTVDRHLAASSLASELRRFDVVLSDRSFYSTLAYQGSRLPPRDRARLEQLQLVATTPPDQVVLLDLPPAWVGRRLRGRGSGRGPLERARTLLGVAAAYRRLARKHRWVILDARLPPTELVAACASALALPRLAAKRPGRGKTISRRAGPGRDR